MLFLLDTCSTYKERDFFICSFTLDGKLEENLDIYYLNTIRVDYGTFEISLKDSNTLHFSRADF